LSPRRLLALTRPVGAGLAHCELTHIAREPIDVARAAAQHAAYEECLRALGCDVRHIPAAPDQPDAVFVEDTAVVLDEVAVITRPGAASRRGETGAVAHALAAFRPLQYIGAPGTMDGGDVLVVDRSVFVGLSTRTNAEGVAQLARVLEPRGYTVRTLAVSSCLHLKSAASSPAPGLVLLNPGWVDAGAFRGVERIDVDPSEPLGGNAVDAGRGVLYAAAFPRTRERLERLGLTVRMVEMDELAKAEGAVTCCSLLFAANGAPAATP
jgi:dimethylargininase